MNPDEENSLQEEKVLKARERKSQEKLMPGSMWDQRWDTKTGPYISHRLISPISPSFDFTTLYKFAKIKAEISGHLVLCSLRLSDLHQST